MKSTSLLLNRKIPDKSKAYQGQCHCGAIKFSFTAPIINSGMRCSCSICIRKGALLSTFTIPPEHLSIIQKDGFLTTYQFASKVAKHYFCKHCGIFTFVQTRLTPDEYRVNLGCLEEINPQLLLVEEFDGQVI